MVVERAITRENWRIAMREIPRLRHLRIQEKSADQEEAPCQGGISDDYCREEQQVVILQAAKTFVRGVIILERFSFVGYVPHI